MESDTEKIAKISAVLIVLGFAFQTPNLDPDVPSTLTLPSELQKLGSSHPESRKLLGNKD